MSKPNARELQLLVAEANELTGKPTLTKAEERRYNFLLSAISLVKQGVSLTDIEQERLNDAEHRNGLPITRKIKESKKEKRGRIWSDVLNGREVRDESVGHNTGARLYPGGYNGLGNFVPFGFIEDLYKGYRWYDPLFDANVCTVIDTPHGRPMTVPVMDDTDEVASVTIETSDQSSNGHNIDRTGGVVLQGYSYRSPLWRLSIEATQDVQAMGGYVNLFKSFVADRIARGVGKDFINGDGVNKPLGIINQLEALSVVPNIAVGSSANTGGSETGANSIGSKDIAALYFSVNQGYRVQPKAAFLMNDNTRLYLAQITTKQGLPLVMWNSDGTATIFGKPVVVCPSMDDIGASKVPVIFGDLSYWVTRIGMEEASYIQIFKETSGLIEQGEVGLRYFGRFDGRIAYTGTAAYAPFGFLQNHS